MAMAEKREATFRTQWVHAIGESDLPPTTRLVALTLTGWMDTEGRCWPARSEIARRAGVSLDTVKRSLKELRTAEYLAWVTSKGRWPNQYQALNRGMGAPVNRSTSAPPTGANETPTGARVHPQPVSARHEKIQEVTKKYPLEVEPPRPSPNGDAALDKDDLTPEEARAAIEWMESERKAHRRKKPDNLGPLDDDERQRLAQGGSWP